MSYCKGECSQRGARVGENCSSDTFCYGRLLCEEKPQPGSVQGEQRGTPADTASSRLLLPVGQGSPHGDLTLLNLQAALSGPSVATEKVGNRIPQYDLDLSPEAEGNWHGHVWPGSVWAPVSWRAWKEQQRLEGELRRQKEEGNRRLVSNTIYVVRKKACVQYDPPLVLLTFVCDLSIYISRFDSSRFYGIVFCKMVKILIREV